MCDTGLGLYGTTTSILDMLFDKQDPVLKEENQEMNLGLEENYMLFNSEVSENISTMDWKNSDTVDWKNNDTVVGSLDDEWNKDADDLLQSVLRDALPTWDNGAIDTAEFDFDTLQPPMQYVDLTAPLDSGASDSGVSCVDQQLSPQPLLSPLSDIPSEVTMSGGESDSDVTCHGNEETSVTDAQPTVSIKFDGHTYQLKEKKIPEQNIPVITVLRKQTPNPRSVLLPISVKDLSNIKTIRIVTTGGTTDPASAQKAAIGNAGTGSARVSTSPLPKKRLLECSDEDEDEESEMSETNEPKRLKLTDEEKRLLKKEGITMPSHYPLTRDEERELKRIRRKIRNKVSAQDSRKRKKEYTDGLEKRVKKCTEENSALMKRIKQLESENQLLTSQVKKLHSLIGRGGPSSNRACLMVLLLSLALVLAPSLRPGADFDDTPLDKSQPSETPVSSIRGGSRSLLSKGPFADPSISAKPDFISWITSAIKQRPVVADSDDEMESEVEAILARSSLADHDYNEPGYKQLDKNEDWLGDYIIPPLDESLEVRALEGNQGGDGMTVAATKRNYSDSSGSVVVKVPKLE